MTAGYRPTVIFVLPDARRLGFQLRMGGGIYLEQVRQAVALLDERYDEEAVNSPTASSDRWQVPCCGENGDGVVDAGNGHLTPGRHIEAERGDV